MIFRTRTGAPTWEDGLIVGSGRVGAVLHGAADDARVCLAHERFFVPANPRPPAPDLRSALPRIRAALAAGDDVTAASLLDDALDDSGLGGLVWTDPLGLCGVLSLSTPGGRHDVERSVDLEAGLATTTWRDGAGAAHRIDATAPRGTDTVWVAVSSERATVVTAALGLSTGDDAAAATFAPDYTGAVGGRFGGGPQGRLEVTDAAGRALAAVTVSTPSGAGSATVPARPWVPADGGLRAEFAVAADRPLLLRLDVHATGTGPVLAPTEPWDAIIARQRETHGSLVRASTLSLAPPGRADAAAASTEDVWATARAGDPDARRRAVEIAYASGRANIIASTGELPATLQGVWQGTWKPAWSADYTMNGNVQNGTLAALVPTGTPELARSFLELVLAHLDDYRENARRVFGADGMLLPARMSTHGRADHVVTAFPHPFWVGAGGWALRIAADLVAVTGDRTIVDDRLWDLVEGVLRFGESATLLIDGERRFTPSYSPENTPAGAASPLAVDATVDVAVHRDAARAARLLALARGDHSLDARWERLAADLPPYRVAADGTLAEWLDPRWRENIAHRHASHLYPLWYEIDPAFTTGPDADALRTAARSTIGRKIAWRAAAPTAPPGNMEMAFGLAQLGLAASALGDARAALRCVEWLALEHWRPGLTTTHDAGSIFNLDASGALPAVVAAMLIGSTIDTVTLLPALPDAWPVGRVTGLRARGGVVIDELSWDEHGATAVLRREPGAAWMTPGYGTGIATGPGFAVRCTTGDAGAGGTASGAVLDLGTGAVTVHLDRVTPAG